MRSVVAGAIVCLGICPAFADSDTNMYQVRRAPGTYSNLPDPAQTKSNSGKLGTCCRESPRWYFGVTGSVVYLRDNDIRNTSSLFPAHDVLGFGLGPGISGAVGYRITNNVRAEFELSERRNDLKTENGQPYVAPSGKYTAQKSTGLMFNVYYDYRNATSFTPYAGLGTGMVEVKNPRYYQIFNGPDVVETKKLDAWTVGYQFMTGISYELDVSSTIFEFTLGYRYFSGQDAETKFKSVPGTISYSNNSHNLDLGGRIYF